MFWLLLAVFVCALLAWLLWAPMRLVVNSEHDMYRLEWYGIGSLQWLPEKGLDCVELNTWFVRRTLCFSDKPKIKEKPAAKVFQKRKKVAKRKRIATKTLLRLARNLLRSFRLRRCHILWDTGNVLLNACLFPVFAVALPGRIQINFLGQNTVDLVLENRLARLVWAVLKTFLFTK